MSTIRVNISSTINSFQEVLDKASTSIEIVRLTKYALEGIDQHPTLTVLEKSLLSAELYLRANESLNNMSMFNGDKLHCLRLYAWELSVTTMGFPAKALRLHLKNLHTLLKDETNDRK